MTAYALPQSSATHLLTLQEAVTLGYGSYQTLRRYIADGRLPAVKIGARVKILRSDLDSLGVPTTTSDSSASGSIGTTAGFDDLAAMAAQVVSTWPRLSPSKRAELGRILATA